MQKQNRAFLCFSTNIHLLTKQGRSYSRRNAFKWFRFSHDSIRVEHTANLMVGHMLCLYMHCMTEGITHTKEQEGCETSGIYVPQIMTALSYWFNRQPSSEDPVMLMPLSMPLTFVLTIPSSVFSQ